LHEFRFTNRSDHVVVPGITAQVGMTYSLSTRSIRPGESGTLSFHIPVGRKAGKLAKYVDVFDTGARELTQKIRFQVDVIPTITTAPEVFSVEVPQGEGATLRTSITGLGIDFEVLPPDSKNLHPMIDVEVGTPLPIMIYERPARRIPVVIRVKPEAPVGPVNASVKFRTNIPARPDVLIQVGVNVVGPLMSRPTRVLFRQTDANDYPFRVVVTARDRMPWMPGAIEVVPIQGGAPTVDWEPSIVDGVFAIILNVHASLNDAEVAPTGNILVRAKGVDHTLTIPYSTVRRPSPRQN
jgi:hypothetical protein